MSDFPAVTTQTVEVKGILLPWERKERYGSELLYTHGPRKGEQMYPDRQPTGTVVDSGEVFIDLDTLYELAEQDVWDSQFGKVFLLHGNAGPALEQAGLAVQETKGGYHRTEKLLDFLEELDG